MRDVAGVVVQEAEVVVVVDEKTRTITIRFPDIWKILILVLLGLTLLNLYNTFTVNATIICEGFSGA